ncbi:MAG: phage tail sheath protein [Oscillospiraceae bacterium]|nr:phage tail sheath protein [Oscillospiraceae bacterium]
MGLPNIEITFRALANTAIQRLTRGTVGIILKDEKDNGACELLKASQVTELLPELGTENQDYIKRAFLGYANPPKKVVVYVLPDTATDYTEAFGYLATQRIDYLVGPPDIDNAGSGEIKLWIKEARKAGGTPKAVLPNTAAEDYAIVNFTTDGIVVDKRVYTTAEYCSRIAGLIAGTPLTIGSCTYAPLPEVERVEGKSKEDMDLAIDAGQFILFGDGVTVKVGRGVNSFTNLAKLPGYNDSFRKIKIVEVMDMIYDDIKKTAQDTYIGKYANSYDNKCLLLTAIGNYFFLLEREGILASGKSTVELDVEAQENYLIGQGADVSSMSVQSIKEANTGAQVFLMAAVSILDAIEDISLKINV